MSQRRAHSVSSSEAASSSGSSDEESSSDKSRKRGGGSDSEELDDLKPTALKMPQLLDPSIFTDFTGLPLLQASSISKDDEFWVVQCPKNFDANLLLNKKINLGGNTKLKVQLEDGTEQKLETHSEEVSESLMTCLLQGATRLQAVTLPVQGKVLITERLEPPEIDYDMFMNLQTKPDKVPFPDNLKMRHPLFGAEYADRISGKAHKSKKSRKRAKLEIEDTSLETSALISSPPKKKKRKHEEEEKKEETPAVASPLSPKKKKRKLEEESEIEATPPPHKKIKIKQELLSQDEESSFNDTISSSKKKKKKKSKHHDDE